MNELLRDLIRFIGAIAGGVKDLTEEYLAFIPRLFKPTLWAMLVIGGLFLLSAITGLGFFYTIGCLVAAVLIFVWIVIMQPFVQLGVELNKFPIINSIFSRVSNAFFLLVIIFIFSLKLSPESDGAGNLGLFLMLAMGCMLVGTKFLKKKLGYNLIGTSMFLALVGYFPLTASSLSFMRHWVDINLASSIVPSAQEYHFSLDKLDRPDSEDDRLFVLNQPRKWCRQDDEGRIWGYRCYNLPGRDQTTNEELVPITEAIVKTIRTRLVQDKVRVEAQLAAEQLAAKQQVEQERLIKINEEKTAYIRKYVSPGGSGVDLATSFANGSLLNAELSNQLQAGFTKPAKLDFLNQPALEDGVFDRLFQGDQSEFERLELAKLSKRLLLGKVNQEIKNNAAIAGVKDASVSIQVRLLNTSTGEILKSSQIDRLSVGYTESDALNKAQSQVVKAILEQFAL